MTIAHPGHPTHPMRPGAPLPPEILKLLPADIMDIDEELRRAEVELLYAAAKHRKAWRVMRDRALKRDAMADQIGMLPTLESDPHWKKATGDVAWWRGEMEAQAALVTALRGMRADRTNLPRTDLRRMPPPPQCAHPADRVLPAQNSREPLCLNCGRTVDVTYERGVNNAQG